MGKGRDERLVTCSHFPSKEAILGVFGTKGAQNSANRKSGATGKPPSLVSQAAKTRSDTMICERISSLALCAALAARKIARLSLRRAVSQEAT